MGEEDKADRGRGGKTTSGNGQAWSSADPRGQWRMWKNGKKTGCEIICGAPTLLSGYGIGNDDDDNDYDDNCGIGMHPTC